MKQEVSEVGIGRGRKYVGGAREVGGALGGHMALMWRTGCVDCALLDGKNLGMCVISSDPVWVCLAVM